MADSKIAILLTLDIDHEGGYVDNPADPGGATNGGITQADMPEVNLKTLTEQDKINYYTENYWKPLYGDIADQSVANKLFDMGVLFGIGEATRIFQETLGIDADGIFGPNTLIDTNGADVSSLIQSYKTRMVTHALAVVTAKPQLRRFITGWIRRINS